jgi:hypothetical protein
LFEAALEKNEKKGKQLADILFDCERFMKDMISEQQVLLEDVSPL